MSSPEENGHLSSAPCWHCPVRQECGESSQNRGVETTVAGGYSFVLSVVIYFLLPLVLAFVGIAMSAGDPIEQFISAVIGLGAGMVVAAVINSQRRTQRRRND